MAFNQFPYSNIHELNLDWMLAEVKNLKKELSDFVDLNTLKWADPPEWDITSRYRENVMVVDDNIGYISAKPIPKGVPITDTTYWIPVLNIQPLFKQLIDQVVGVSKKLVNKSLTDSNCVAIGDSYARGTGGVVGRGVFYYLAPFFKTFTSRANGGAGYVTPGNTGSGDFNGKTFPQALSDLADSMRDVDRAAVSYVICTGGLNDSGKSDTEIKNGVENFIAIAHTNFPNAAIFCFTPWCDSVFSAARYYNALSRVEFYASARGAAINSTIKYWFIGRAEYGAGDNIHLNEDGYAILANRYAAIITGNVDDIGTVMGDGDVTGDATASYRSVTIGKTAYLTGNFIATYNNADNPTLLTLSANKRPQKTFYIPVVAYGADTQVVVAEFNSTGRLRIMPAFARKLTGEYTIYINHSWLVGF